MNKLMKTKIAVAASLMICSAGISYITCRLTTPVVAAFDMKATIDAFFDSASKKSLDEAQAKKLSDRFNSALEDSLSAWQERHRALILVSPAVIQGAPDITREIQRDVAQRMKTEL